MPAIDEYLKEVLSKKGSDLHFLAGDPPRIRLYGDLQPLRNERLEKDFVQQTMYEIMPKTAVKRFEEHDGADFAYNMGEYGRFRVNVMRQLNGMGAVMRAIPSKALSMAQLNLPQACHALCRANNGLILVTGKPGSGKSTTLAGWISSSSATGAPTRAKLRSDVPRPRRIAGIPACCCAAREAEWLPRRFDTAFAGGLRLRDSLATPARFVLAIQRSIAR